jgi:hypothetical protein
MAIYVPSSGPSAWQQLLADPERHWRTGYSARSLAHAWENAETLPAEISALFGGDVHLLIGLPEHKVDLPGGKRPSQTDLFALLRWQEKTVSCAIEGKVDESFGPTLEEWLSEATAGKLNRLAFICDLLGLNRYTIPRELRYQLLHRTASAIIEAGRFKTDAAAMIVHSFSPTSTWFADYGLFLQLFGLDAEVDRLKTMTLPSGLALHLAWAKGNPKFLLA